HRAPWEDIFLPGLHPLPAIDFTCQRLVTSEQGRARRADLRASGNIPLRQLVLAELAFGDLRRWRVVLELRDAVRAGGDAVAASDAGVGIVTDGAGDRVLCHCAYGANRDARWVDAVQALPLDMGEAVFLFVLMLARSVLVELDDGIGAARQLERRVPQFLAEIVFQRQRVGGLARGHAGLAADAKRGIVEKPDGVIGDGFVASRLGRVNT